MYKPEIRTLNDILHFNTTRFGLQELLRYADINSMAHSREVRLPFLSHELVSFIFSLPATFKIHDGWTKWLLRKTMENKLPNEITWRTDKTGFEPPEKQWMRDPEMQEPINHAKSELANLRILNKNIVDKKNQPVPEKTADNADFRYVVAQKLLHR